MRAAIYESIFRQGAANSTLNINCPTGNCTFTPADTLGFCSKCNDVTIDVKSNCSSSQVQDYPDGTLNKNCTYHLPGNVNLDVQSNIVVDDFQGPVSRSSQFRQNTNMSVGALNRYETLYAAGITESPGSGIVTQGPFNPGTTFFQDIPSPLLAFGRVVFNNSFNPMPIIGGDIQPHATECALYWCVQSLNTSVQNGVLSQNITGTYFNTSARDTPDAFLQPPLSNEDELRSYYVSTIGQLPLAKFLQDTFTGNVSFMNLPGSDHTQDEIDELTRYSSDAVQALWNTEDLDNLMTNMANRLTDTLRNQFADPTFSKPGNVQVTQVYVSVRWPWLVLPVALVITSCGLLLASIVSSSGKKDVVWKNSSLAVLFHGFNGGAGDGPGYAVGKLDMEREAEGMQVQLQENRDGALHLMDAGSVAGGGGNDQPSWLRRRFGGEK